MVSFVLLLDLPWILTLLGPTGRGKIRSCVKGAAYRIDIRQLTDEARKPLSVSTLIFAATHVRLSPSSSGLGTLFSTLYCISLSCLS